MTSTSKPNNNPCPVTFALDVFGDRWTLKILRDLLLDHQYSYKALLAANPGIATNVLADRLKRLEMRKLVTKTKDNNDARQFLYKPTELGISVMPMLVEMIVWGTKHGQGKVEKTFLKQFETGRGKLLRYLQTQSRHQAELSK